MIAAWIAAPLLLAAMAVGCGLLLESVTRRRLPGPLLPGVGVAAIIVIGQFTTSLDATAELTVPVVVGLAVAGLVVSAPWPGRRPNPWMLASAVGVFAAYGAPVLLSGEATFAGFIKLDDTATWMALTDRIMEDGRSLEGLAPSSYEATLDFNLADGYPVGVFIPLGVVAALTGQDVAWVFQPYVAFLGALLALTLWHLAAPLVRPPALRALVAFLAAQPALLFGYSLWGGVKEVAAAALLALVAALAPVVADKKADARTFVPLAVAAAGLLGTLSLGGAVWLFPLLVPVLLALVRTTGLRPALALAVPFVLLVAALTLPLPASGALIPPTSLPLTSSAGIGNLIEPLSPLQLFGVWPSGDFRIEPTQLTVARLLVIAVGVAGVVGLLFAWRARAWGLLIYVLGVVAGAAGIAAFGSPWVDGKALATASPALLAAALVAGAVYLAHDRRIPGLLILAAVGGGVLWSNLLAYHDVNLAPRDQLVELERIGEEIEGEGPALMTEYLPYGVRHFLRDADPEGVSELRRRPILLRDGSPVEKGFSADTDELDLSGLLVYRTLVLRRSPAQSRPPWPYRLTSSGRHYEVWQRPTEPVRAIEHLPLGGELDPSAVPACAEVRRLAASASAGILLAARPSVPNVALTLDSLDHPQDWALASGGTLLPEGSGTVAGEIEVPRAGSYEIWLGGSVHGRLELWIDGEQAGALRHELNNAGQYMLLAETDLAAGLRQLELRLEAGGPAPGSGGRADPIGPLVISGVGGGDVLHLPADRAEELCGKRWDWVEALGSRP